MAGHKALGRGLNALFSSTQSVSPEAKEPGKTEGGAKTNPAVQELPINNIRPNRHQPRTQFDPAALEDLSHSIKLHGIAQPLVVTKTHEPGEYEIVVGERRLRAAKLAGLATVPCIIKKFTNQQRFEVALIENLQREDLNSLEEAVALDGLMKEYNLTQDQVATAIGKSRSAVANTLRFLRLHEDVQSALRTGTINEGHAKILAGLQEHSEQLRYLGKITSEHMTVRDLEHILAHKNPKKKKSSAPLKSTDKFPEARKYEEDIQRQLGRRVEIQSSGGKKGWIRFAFYSPWDLEMFLKKLGLFEGKVSDPGEAPKEN